MGTSTVQQIATVPVWDYVMATGDPSNPNPKGALGKTVKVTLVPNLEQSASPVTFIGPDPVITKTDSNGFWQVNLIPNNKLSPASSLYTVEIEGGRSYLINVTDVNVPVGGWQSSAIAVALPVGGGVGYTLPGGTTVLGNLQINASDIIAGPDPWYDVKHPSFAGGAKGDGVTDDTAAIQAAINAANIGGGGIVFFPQGTYIINGTTGIDLTTVQNVTLKGTGWGSSLQVPNTGTGTKHVFNNTGVATMVNLVVEDLDLNMLYSGTTWDFLNIGAGTVAGLRFNRVQMRCVNYTGAIPYLVNASATASRGFTDWHFTKCRFFSPGNASINGMIVRGFDGLELDGNEWVNINNPVIPDALLQKYNLRFTNNKEIYTVSNPGVINMEGFDVMGCQGVVCINNQQWSTVAQAGTSDIGGVLIDTHAGLITNGVVIAGNTFYGNPIQIAPQNGAPVTDCVIASNTIWGTRSTGGGINSCVQLGGPDAGTSARIIVQGNTCDGPFTGNPIFIGTGYAAGAIICQDNPGANPLTVQTPAFAASFTPVLASGTIIAPGALTANMTVNAFAAPIVGTSVTFIFTQDGTGGRTLTWNAAYKTAWQPARAANAVSSVSFTYDGTNWQQSAGQVSVDQSGNASVQGTLAFTPAAGQVIGGASSFSVRNNANNADNLLVLDGGSTQIRSNLTLLAGLFFGPAVGKLVPGATSFSWRNSGDSADNLIITDAGVATFRGGFQIDAAGHLVSSASGTPVTSNLGANVTSVTFTGNDVRGKIAVVMSGALAANTRIATCTYASAYGATPGVVILVNETSAAGITIVNFYPSAEAAGSFDLFCDQALAAGTYTIKYVVIG